MLKKFLWKNKWLLLIVFIAGALRLLGISHGFPFIFHPDEPTVVRSALEVRFFPNPGHFDWPHLYIYLNYFLYMVFAKFRDLVVGVGLQDTFSNLFPLMWNDVLIFYWLTRVLSALLGTLTIIPVYLTAKELFNKRSGLFSSLVMALLPFHVWHSHYSVIDVPMVFFFSWSIYFSVLTLKKSKLWPYLLSGFFVGLAASTKYHGALSAVVLVLIYLVKFLIERRSPRALLTNFYKLLLAGLASLAGFLLGTPYALLDWETFSRTDGPKGAFWQFTNVGSVTLSRQLSQFVSVFTGKFLQDWSPLVVFLFLTALAYAIYKSLKSGGTSGERVRPLLVFIPALLYIFYISGFSKNRSHYYMISYPLVAIGVGWFVAELQRLPRYYARFFLLPALFAVPLVMSALNTVRFMREDTRALMGEWVRSSPEYEKYALYYNGEYFKQVLPEAASKLSDDTDYKQLQRPYIVFKECSEEDRDFYTLVIDSSLRRGPKVCIYVQD